MADEDKHLIPAWSISDIKNKQRRNDEYLKLRLEKQKLKIARRKAIRKAIAAGKDVPKQIPRTLENTREPDETMVDPDDQEIQVDQSIDEFSSYYNREETPKVLITCSENPHTWTIRFCRELKVLIQDSIFLYRKRASLKHLVEEAKKRDFTNIVVVTEDRRHPTGMLVIHLPEGPTAFFRVSSVKYCKNIKNRAECTSHKPEIVMNNFRTRLGLSIGRLFTSLFQYNPDFHGRRVVTFHNQRDYIFVRHHRYEFKSAKRAALQEIGPRFTLRLRSLQKNTFDSKFGEYEWILKRHEMETSRRRFFL
ncbi:ribosome production factor 1 [Trichonephila inaurata madagascariensis]|uniref:Ribosome production factor 1 n=1 Tax=Trichonephila inaurata madagascariensis TaxID=2747483 RepID=A0A8X7BU67_9ARAC|nr:ribosome production factor 1 [Trichonephila inaurata madagascariensis]